MSSLRYNTNIREPYDIAPDLQRVLNANGMQAHLSKNVDGKYQLVTNSHNNTSNFRYYNLTNAQLEALIDGGSTYSSKKAYTTFVSIVKNDYYVPQSFVAARNVNSPVRMGLDGYRVNPGEYGYDPMSRFTSYNHGRFGRFDGRLHTNPFFGLFEPHYNARRVGGKLFFDAGAPVMMERPGGKLKPGELKSGSYGFYDKGNQANDSLSNMKVQVAKPVINKLSDEDKKKVITLNDLFGHKAYNQNLATGETFNAMLRTHGIDIYKDEKGVGYLKVKPNGHDRTYRYELTKDEMAVLFNDKMKIPFAATKKHKARVVNPDGKNVSERLDVINKVISVDFDTKITKQMLNEKDLVNLDLNAHGKEVNAKQDQAQGQAQQVNDIIDMQNVREDYRSGFIDQWNTIGVVDGRSLDQSQGFYLPVKNGRAVSVGEIQAYPSNDGGDRGLTYKMTAVINDKVFTHDITKEDYIKFLNYDDEHRLQLFDKNFKEVQIKSARNGQYVDASPSDKLENTTTTAKMNGQFSFVSGKEATTITAAMAWKDEVSGNYVLNVRDDKDAGMWSFKISEADYLAFSNANDSEKAKMLETLVPWNEQMKGNIKVIPSERLMSHHLEGISQEYKVTPALQKALSDLKAAGIGYEFINKPKYSDQERFDGLKKGFEKLHNSVTINGEKMKMPSDQEIWKMIKENPIQSTKEGVDMAGHNVKSSPLYASLPSDSKDLRKLANDIEKRAEKAYPALIFKKLSDKELSDIASKSANVNEFAKNIFIKNNKLVDFDKQTFKEVVVGNEHIEHHIQADAKNNQKVKDANKNIIQVSGKNYNLNELREKTKINLRGDAGVNGESLNNIKESKEWKRSGEHGRNVSVGDITVEKAKDADGRPLEGKYKMSAVIDGNVITHEINQKQYDKFLSVTDYQRMKLFDKVFPEVEMKVKEGKGFNLGAAILAAMTVGVGVAAAMSKGRPEPHHRPEIYGEVYSKPGVISPHTVASALYEDKVSHDIDQAQSRGMGMGV